MKRLGVLLATFAIVAVGVATPVSAAPATGVPATVYKINVMGGYAHPDDDIGMIAPCAVWQQAYNIRCGVLASTRGEGGGNAVGTEEGQALGLRRENEERIAHYRSGTIDFFFADAVDFFYNQSAPLTEFFWGHDRTLSRFVRIVRQTQPDIMLGHSPTLGAGHGNHQWTGRLVWEAAAAAANPAAFPEQLDTSRNGWLTTWQVKKVASGGNTDGSGGIDAPNCNTGFVPATTPSFPPFADFFGAYPNYDNVTGTWSGFPSPYLWPVGNLQAQTPGTPKIWFQVAGEEAAAYPTQSTVMLKGLATPSFFLSKCSRFGTDESYVPFQPNLLPSGATNPLAGMDNALLFGATIPDPGGLPLGTIEYLTFSRFFNVAAQPFQATLHVRSGSGTLAAGTAALTVPTGWTVTGPTSIGPILPTAESTATFTVTPAAGAVSMRYGISALLTTGAATGYTDNVMEIVPAAEGRFQRWGNWAEYEQWLATSAPQAYRLGRAHAVQSIGIGETMQLPVVVHNWTTVPQSGTVTLTPPADITPDAVSKPYGPLAGGADTTVTFTITNTDTVLPGGVNSGTGPQTISIPITTSYSAPAGSASETLSLVLVPTTVIPQAASAPVLDAAESPGEYTGPALDLSRVWSGSCNPVTKPCGNPTGAAPGDPASSYAKVTWTNDTLYLFVHVMDNYQSYAVTPQECVAHWLADSVEILIDPRGNGSQQLLDTAAAFKLGVFPFSNDPTNFNGNGANGPCWERDADNHQGFSTGPLAAGLIGGPNAVGVQVVSSVTWVGNNTAAPTPGPRGNPGGYYNLKVKIPMADLPAAVGPTATGPSDPTAWTSHLGLNITPYDNDNTSATAPAGGGLLRHIDNSTRLGWAASSGSVQSDPYRWGHAFLAGYTPPPGRPTTTATPILQNTNLDSADSPQSILNTATNRVPLAGREPAPVADSMSITSVAMTPSTVTLKLDATGTGSAHVYLYAGDPHAIPVYNTSCTQAADPWPDWSFTPCNAADGTIPPWSPDMSGRVIRDVTVPVAGGPQTVTIPLDAAAYASLTATGNNLTTGGYALVSFKSTVLDPYGLNGVQSFALVTTNTVVTADYDPTQFGHPVTFTAAVTATVPGGTPTGSVQFYVDGVASGAPVPLDATAHGTFTTSALAIGTHAVHAIYSGDAGFVGSRSPSINHSVKKRLSTTTAVTSGLNPSVYGGPVTFTATVTPENPSSGLVPTGFVQWKADGVAVGGPVALNAVGQATVTTNMLAAGHRGIRAQYLADANYTGSTSPTFTQTVKKATPTGTVSSLPLPPIVYGTKPIVFTATFANPAPIGSLTPAMVQFLIDGTSLGPPVALDPSYHASFTVTWNLPVGSHQVRAKYLGSANFLAVQTPGFTFVVNSGPV